MKKMIEVVLVMAVLGGLTSCQSGKKEISQETTRSMSGAAAAGESEEDPAAHWARSWEECMTMPSEEQMEALKKVTGNAVDADEYYPALATLYYDLKEQF